MEKIVLTFFAFSMLITLAISQTSTAYRNERNTKNRQTLKTPTWKSAIAVDIHVNVNATQKYARSFGRYWKKTKFLKNDQCDSYAFPLYFSTPKKVLKRIKKLLRNVATKSQNVERSLTVTANIAPINLDMFQLCLLEISSEIRRINQLIETDARLEADAGFSKSNVRDTLLTADQGILVAFSTNVIASPLDKFRYI